ncbi:MAG: hypothetical protein H0U05_11370 [Actinobacteria bacterium]|nr:hypothetical protein [Actinomycetota bacterium]
MTRCHICERPVEHDRDPYYVKNDPGHYDDERFEVAMGNHLFVRACWSCWMRWPDRHKRREGCLTIPEREALVELLGETA